MTRTEEALSLAKENFRETQAVVDRFGLQLDSELALIPGTEHLRRAALNDVIGHYRGFIRRSEQSEGFTENLAITLNKVASLTERIGSAKEAMTAHREARAAFEQLLQTDPAHQGWKSGRALCDNNIGLLFASSVSGKGIIGVAVGVGKFKNFQRPSHRSCLRMTHSEHR